MIGSNAANTVCIHKKQIFLKWHLPIQFDFPMKYSETSDTLYLLLDQTGPLLTGIVSNLQHKTYD